MAIPVKLQVFEGPLDLLLHLIDKNKIDIYDIPIVTITDQYLAYVRDMDTEDMDVTSEFLVMAATLLDIKSRMLLPKDPEQEEEEEDPREELVRRLLEYKMYKYMAGELRDRSITAGHSLYREQSLPPEVESYTPPVNYEELLGRATLDRLKELFAESLKRKKDRQDPVRSGFGQIRREEVSATQKQLYVEAWLQSHPQTDFQSLLEQQDSREEIIVTFLVILELIKASRVKVRQDEIFGTIWLEVPPKEEAAEGETEAEAEEISDTEAEPETEPAAEEISRTEAELETDETLGEPEDDFSEQEEEEPGEFPEMTYLPQKSVPLAVTGRVREPAVTLFPEIPDSAEEEPEPVEEPETEPAEEEPEEETETEEEEVEVIWTERERHPLSSRYCLSWARRWRSNGSRRRSSSRRRMYAPPSRFWRRNMPRRGADLL